MNIRPALLSDAAALAEIYAPYVLETDVTFDTEPPTAEWFEGKIKDITEFYPFIVADDGEGLLGYAYAHEFRPRAAFVWSVETTVYVRLDCRGRGIGRALCQSLEELLREQGIINLYACVTDTNKDSVAFHERLGYGFVGRFENCGYKRGHWLGVTWLCKTVGVHADPPGEVRAANSGRR